MTQDYTITSLIFYHQNPKPQSFHIISTFPHPNNTPNKLYTSSPLNSFPPVASAEVLHFINKSSTKSSFSDFILMSFIKFCSSVFSKLIANLANLSIPQVTFHSSSKQPLSLQCSRNLDLTKTLLVITSNFKL